MDVNSRQSTHTIPPGLNHQCYESQDGYQHLQAHVSPRAFAADQEGDAPKCHPNTRLAVLQDIMTWILVTLSDRLTWFMWVFGAAGAGKSAIARSIVENCLQEDLVIARFFFFRADNSRNTLAHVVATLAYQLIQQLPELDPIISARVRFHPLVFHDSLEIQLHKLIFEPLQKLHRDSPIAKSIVLLFDGVDELHGEKNQTLLIQLLHKFITSKTVPVVALFLSRPELHIQGEFQSRNIMPITTNLALDDNYLPDIDIRRYLEDSFDDIKEKHAFRRFLPDIWPSSEAVNELVRKASGQFIFAAVVIAYISDARANPAKQLDIIRGIRPVSGPHAPFAQLDALYCYLFSQVRNIERVMLILATFILQSATDELIKCAELHCLAVEEIEIALADLTSIIQCRDGCISFLHASLADFLLDPHRAGPYFIDKTVWCTRLSMLSLSRQSNDISGVAMLAAFIASAEPNHTLRQAVIDADSIWEVSWYTFRYLDALKKIDFGDGGEAYRRVIDHIIGDYIATDTSKLEEICHRHRASDHYIRQFFVAGFADIVEKHPFRWMLPEGWPDNDTVNELVANSSGQFLYAYVAIQEISKPRSNPALVLENIRHIRPPHGILDIYAPLDALYTYMLSQSFDLDRTIAILAACIIGILPTSHIARLYHISFDDIQVALADLTSVISCTHQQIAFLRESFNQFLWDRSLQYHINRQIWATQLAVKHLQDNIHLDFRILSRCLDHAVITSELREAIFNANHDIDMGDTLNVNELCSYLGDLRFDDFDGEGELYRKELNWYTRWAYAYHPSYLQQISEAHDIATILRSIQEAEAELHSPQGVPVESDSDYYSADSDPEVD